MIEHDDENGEAPSNGARLVSITSGSGKTYWINPAHVRYVREISPEKCEIKFSDQDSLVVNEFVGNVAQELDPSIPD